MKHWKHPKRNCRICLGKNEDIDPETSIWVRMAGMKWVSKLVTANQEKYRNGGMKWDIVDVRSRCENPPTMSILNPPTWVYDVYG